MNVLQLCTKVPYPPKDGGSVAINAFTCLLRLCNFDVTILAANTPKHFQSEAISLQEGVKLFTVPVNTNLNVISLVINYIFSGLPYQVSRFRCREYSDRLRELLGQKSFDIIQLEGAHMGVYLPEIRKYSSAKVILRAHNVEHLIWNELTLATKSIVRRHYLRVMTKRFKEFETQLFSNVEAVIPISAHDQKQIELFTRPEKCMVISSGITIADYLPQPGAVANSVFFIGALDWIPNQNGLLWFLDNVWPMLLKRMPGINFHIAGRNAPLWLKKRLLAENVYFYGEISDAKEFINRFQIMVVPLFSGSGIRIKILEAMALKKAVVTTPKGAEGMNVTSGNELVIAKDINEFENEIIRLLNNRTIRNSFGDEARAYISKEFDNLGLASRAEGFYRSICTV